MRIISAALATALFAGMTFGAVAAPTAQGVKAQSTFELIKSKKQVVKKHQAKAKKHAAKKHHKKGKAHKKAKPEEKFLGLF